MAGENSFGAVLTSLRQERLKAARAQRDKLEAAKWGTIRVAKELGITRQTYSGWENGHHQPQPNDLRAIVRVFRLSDEERDALYLSAARVPPKRHNLPTKNDFFTGRKTHLEQISKQLQENGAVGIIQAVSISGLGGIGKTQLALEYAHRHLAANTYRAVLWVNAADKATLRASYDELLRKLDLPEQNEREAERRVQAVQQWLVLQW
ncbi:MAG: helix-turn-helix transcriptional regulator [Ktedonobacteraceae bacterium]